MSQTVTDLVGQAAVSVLIHSLHSCCAVSIHVLVWEFVKKYLSHSVASINVCMHAHAFLCMYVCVCVCLCRSEVTVLSRDNDRRSKEPKAPDPEPTVYRATASHCSPTDRC